jgi:hypothetical protein
MLRRRKRKLKKSKVGRMKMDEDANEMSRYQRLIRKIGIYDMETAGAAMLFPAGLGLMVAWGYLTTSTFNPDHHREIKLRHEIANVEEGSVQHKSLESQLEQVKSTESYNQAKTKMFLGVPIGITSVVFGGLGMLLMHYGSRKEDDLGIDNSGTGSGFYQRNYLE